MKPYEISVISADGYDNLVAEIKFSNVLLGAILSQERSLEQFEISVFSFVENARRRFYETEKIDKLPVDLDIFLEAVTAARERLRLLDVPR